MSHLFLKLTRAPAFLPNPANTGPNDGIAYEAYAQYGRVTADLEDTEALTSRYYQSLDVIADANGNPVCRDPSGGCVARNPFNFQASRDSIAFSDAGVVNKEEITQFLIGASINGDLLKLPAGTVRYAAGLEYRDKEAEFRPDPLTSARDPDGVGSGLVVGNAGLTRVENTFAAVIQGDSSVAEIFGELVIPVLADKPFVEQLDVELAARFADYDLVGQTANYKTGLNWTISSNVRLRGTYSRAGNSRVPDRYRPMRCATTRTRTQPG